VTSPDPGYVHEFQPAARAGLPTLLLLHGTGGDEHDLLPLGRLLLPGAALLSPRGNVLERGAPRFFRRFAEGVFDTADVARRAGELAAFVRDSAARYEFDASDVIAAGFSNGANIAGAMMLLEPGVMRGGVLFRAQMVVDEAGPGARPAALGGTSVFLAGGKSDPIVPVAETERLAAALRAAGAEVTLRWDESGHTLTKGDVEDAARWLAALPPRA
jgi:predicted esterase